MIKLELHPSACQVKEKSAAVLTTDIFSTINLVL